jgi:hypothetical protein
MKISNISFPHPVLGINPPGFEPDVVGDFRVTYQETITNKLKVEANYELLNSSQIAGLITRGDAVFACEVNCRKTAYRNIFTPQPNHPIEIDTELLRDEVEFDFYILASKDFDYIDEGKWHTDYQGKVFKVQKGMLLAYGGKKKTLIIWDPVSKQRNSLLTVEPGDDDVGPFEVDIYSETIDIYLPKKTFLIFSAIYESHPEYQNSFHASLAVPAIAKAFMAMESKDISQIEQIEEKKWYQSIKIRMETDSVLSAEDDPFKRAQRLLNNPFSLLSEGLLKSQIAEEE